MAVLELLVDAIGLHWVLSPLSYAPTIKNIDIWGDLYRHSITIEAWDVDFCSENDCIRPLGRPVRGNRMSNASADSGSMTVNSWLP